LLLGICSLQAQKQPPSDEQSCLDFTQAFYNWYVTEVFKGFKTNNGKAPWHAALNYQRNPFIHELTRALIKSDAEAKADGDPVLDFDPILNSQDPADRFVVRSVTRKNGRYWADVYSVWSRPFSDQGKGPDVVAEITRKDSRWQFVNFHYPNKMALDDYHLLGILKFRYHAR
jgi:hypothetical protein